MGFSYYDNYNQKQDLNLFVGTCWKEEFSNNTFLNTIFNKIDDGDGIISNIEIAMVENFFKKISKDNILDEKEKNFFLRTLDQTQRIDLYQETITNLKIEDFTINTLRKRFPESRYDIVNEESCIRIIDKNNNKIALSLEIYNGKLKNISEYSDTGELIVNNNYNDEGILIENTVLTKEKIKKKQNSPKTLLEEFWRFLNSKHQITNLVDRTLYLEKIKDFVYQINSKNVIDNENFGYISFLMLRIINDGLIDTTEKMEYLGHIKNAVLEYYKEQGIYVDDISEDFDREFLFLSNRPTPSNSYNDFLNNFIIELQTRVEGANLHLGNLNQINQAPNGEIDGDFLQGRTGDCWLLASIIAINNTPRGKEILNESLEHNSDGSVTVHLKGVDKTYTISKEDLQGRSDLAIGDLDVRALEIAFDKYFYEIRSVNNENTINGNFSFIAYEILLGKSISSDFINVNEETGYRESKSIEISDEMIEGFNTLNSVTTVSSINTENETSDRIISAKVINESDNSVLYNQELHKNHAYAVIGSDSENVYLVNPHNTIEKLAISHEDFKAFFNRVEQIQL